MDLYILGLWQTPTGSGIRPKTQEAVQDEEIEGRLRTLHRVVPVTHLLKHLFQAVYLEDQEVAVFRWC